MRQYTAQTTRTHPQGFTLVELVLVMIIIGVIAAIAMPRFAQATARQQLDAAANRLVSDLEKAQHHARSTSNQVTLSFDTRDNSYSFTPAFGTAYTVQLDEPPYQVTMPVAEFNGATTVSFNGFGIPSESGAVKLATGSGTAVITLGADGRATRE